jgi:hypothetical protein
MDNNKKIEEKLNQVMNSLDGIQQADPGPFFFTRVQARLVREKGAGTFGLFLNYVSKPSVALAGISMIILINAAVLFYHKAGTGSNNANEQIETAYSEDFNTTVATNSYYDENTELR